MRPTLGSRDTSLDCREVGGGCRLGAEHNSGARDRNVGASDAYKSVGDDYLTASSFVIRGRPVRGGLAICRVRLGCSSWYGYSALPISIIPCCLRASGSRKRLIASGFAKSGNRYFGSSPPEQLLRSDGGVRRPAVCLRGWLSEVYVPEKFRFSRYLVNLMETPVNFFLILHKEIGSRRRLM